MTYFEELARDPDQVAPGHFPLEVCIDFVCGRKA